MIWIQQVHHMHWWIGLKCCPNLTNLKARVTDDDVIYLKDLKNLQHLELRYYTGIHHHIGHETHKYFRSKEYRNLTSLTIYCNFLYTRHIVIISDNCSNLNKLFLHANQCVLDSELQDCHLESVRTLLLEHYLNGSWESLVLVHYVKHVIIINLLQANVDTCR